MFSHQILRQHILQIREILDEIVLYAFQMTYPDIKKKIVLKNAAINLVNLRRSNVNFNKITIRKHKNVVLEEKKPRNEKEASVFSLHMITINAKKWIDVS